MAAIASASGLVQMQTLAASQAGSAGMGRLMGMDGVEAGEGWMLFHAIPAAAHGNPIGITHGGFAATLLATGVAVCMIMASNNEGVQ